MGKFSSEYLASSESSCQSCPSGQFSNSTGQSSCELCPSGTYAEATAHSRCLKCNLQTEFEFGSTSCLFFDTTSIVIVAAVLLVVVGIIATVAYFVCCIAKRKKKKTGAQELSNMTVDAKNSHLQRLQVSDGSRIDSPKELPEGHPYRRDDTPQASDIESPAFEMAQRRYKSKRQANVERVQDNAQPHSERERTPSPIFDDDVAFEEQRTMQYDFNANPDDPNQVSATKGEVVDVMEIFEDGWIKVRRTKGGQVGLVPESYTA